MKTKKNAEVWSKIGDKRARFGLEEFVLVTRLNEGDENDVDKTLGAECRIVKEYFKNSGGKLRRKVSTMHLHVLEVNSTLIPTVAELEEIYRKELTPIVEEDESASHYSEGHGAEHAYHEESPRTTQPPQRGRFHPATNAFDGATSSIGGLEKEAQFDDVTDVPAAERKVDLLLEDPKLDEEIRGKNVGGKELETEPGFDDVRDVSAAKRNVEVREEYPKLEEEVRGKNVKGKDLEKGVGSGNDIDEQKNDKNGRGMCCKKIILEEEHPDVEKDIADFVTPENHDVDINESTQDGSVEINEAGCDPPKGRVSSEEKTALIVFSLHGPDEEEKVVRYRCI
ncbi:Hypothetical predicted protein [Olea europaea subsp. europaea]|uniref:Uncharacterized protein n=1 Tax=Olea europaea subsp. europaea TaxID=158383 RepID=A0A8S0RAU8_OLEEU|nr:Hypothetical predicted protein [Olea europaea subsp. europaea]